MSYLLDTKVVSELRRKLHNPSVVSWFSHRPASTLFLSVLTLGELRMALMAPQTPPGVWPYRTGWKLNCPAFLQGVF